MDTKEALDVLDQRITEVFANESLTIPGAALQLAAVLGTAMVSALLAIHDAILWYGHGKE